MLEKVLTSKFWELLILCVIIFALAFPMFITTPSLSFQAPAVQAVEDPPISSADVPLVTDADILAENSTWKAVDMLMDATYGNVWLFYENEAAKTDPTLPKYVALTFSPAMMESPFLIVYYVNDALEFFQRPFPEECKTFECVDFTHWIRNSEAQGKTDIHEIVLNMFSEYWDDIKIPAPRTSL